MAFLLPGEERIIVCGRTVGAIRQDETGAWWGIGPMMTAGSGRWRAGATPWTTSSGPTRTDRPGEQGANRRKGASF
ncbi:hypothetical protein [Brevundimonas denitrificans]|uniref:hypothetical protein n=1 Tax=Brevundimonas denitrificans TaxID=1443434 RepID=UPI00223C008E|nr:hypothetical protein [Brevundimonas denitrificans]